MDIRKLYKSKTKPMEVLSKSHRSPIVLRGCYGACNGDRKHRDLTIGQFYNLTEQRPIYDLMRARTVDAPALQQGIIYTSTPFGVCRRAACVPTGNIGQILPRPLPPPLRAGEFRVYHTNRMFYRTAIKINIKKYSNELQSNVQKRIGSSCRCDFGHISQVAKNRQTSISRYGDNSPTTIATTSRRGISV